MGGAAVIEVRIERPGVRVDSRHLEAHLKDIDPSSMLDLEPASGALRISTVMPTQELLHALRAGGISIGPEALIHLPSVCCGGCSG